MDPFPSRTAEVAYFNGPGDDHRYEFLGGLCALSGDGGKAADHLWPHTRVAFWEKVLPDPPSERRVFHQEERSRARTELGQEEEKEWRMIC
jgi:hypothetical protein